MTRARLESNCADSLFWSLKLFIVFYLVRCTVAPTTSPHTHPCSFSYLPINGRLCGVFSSYFTNISSVRRHLDFIVIINLYVRGPSTVNPFCECFIVVTIHVHTHTHIAKHIRKTCVRTREKGKQEYNRCKTNQTSELIHNFRQNV